MTSNPDIFRQFLAAFMDPELDHFEIRREWSMTPGLFKAIKEGADFMRNVLGIHVSETPGKNGEKHPKQTGLYFSKNLATPPDQNKHSFFIYPDDSLSI